MTSPLSAAQTSALAGLIDLWSGHRVVLIGAGALSFYIPMTWRRTNDIDLAIATDIATASSGLRARGFQQDPTFEHRWLRDGGVTIDVLPVTDEDLRNGQMTWPISEQVMSLDGFDLLFEHSERHPLDADHVVEVASPATLMLLKMAAWLERPNERLRDLQDIGALLCGYLGEVDARHWDDDRLAGTELELHSALALGLDIAAIAQTRHHQLVGRFVSRLEQSPYAFETLARVGRSEGRERQEQTRLRLAAFRRGVAP
jgi:predicted nucleotidyltransferase